MIDSRSTYLAVLCLALMTFAMIAGCESPVGDRMPLIKREPMELTDTITVYSSSKFALDLSMLPKCDTGTSVGDITGIELQSAEFVLLDPLTSYSAVDSIVVTGGDSMGRTGIRPDTGSTIAVLDYRGNGSRTEFCDDGKRSLFAELHLHSLPVSPFRIRIRLTFQMIKISG